MIRNSIDYSEYGIQISDFNFWDQLIYNSYIKIINPIAHQKLYNKPNGSFTLFKRENFPNYIIYYIYQFEPKTTFIQTNTKTQRVYYV
jgi:hypothetical protein